MPSAARREERYPKIGDDLRRVMAGMMQIDARIGVLQTTCIYVGYP
jgi:hypothetical protein